MKINKKFLTHVVVMTFAIIVSMSFQTAMAQNMPENSNDLLDQLRNGTETSYKISISTDIGSRAVGIFGDCNVPGFEVKESECVFSVDEVRYSNTQSGLDQTKFEVICIDNITARNDLSQTRWSNCSFLDRGAMSIGGSVGLPIGFGLIGTSGEITSSIIDMEFSKETDVGLSYDAIRLEYLMINTVDKFQGQPFGGNVLADSGIGSVLATKYVILAHDDFHGTVEFVGTKPLHMKMFTGNIANADNPTCFDASGGELPGCGRDHVDVDFNIALELAFPILFFAKSSVDANAVPTATNVIDNVDAEIIDEVLLTAGPQFVEINSLNQELALDVVDLDEVLFLYKELRSLNLVNQLANQLVLELGKIDLESMYSRILLALGGIDLRPPLKLIDNLQEPLATIEGLVDDIPSTDVIEADLSNISGNLTELDTAIDGAGVTFNLPDDFSGWECTVPVRGTPTCDGSESFTISKVTCTIDPKGGGFCSVTEQKTHVGNGVLCHEVKISGDTLKTKIVGGGCCTGGKCLAS